MAPVMPAISGTTSTSESSSAPSVAVPSAALPESPVGVAVGGASGAPGKGSSEPSPVVDAWCRAAAPSPARPARYRVSRTSRRTFDSWGAYDRTVRRASTAVS